MEWWNIGRMWYIPLCGGMLEYWNTGIMDKKILSERAYIEYQVSSIEYPVSSIENRVSSIKNLV